MAANSQTAATTNNYLCPNISFAGLSAFIGQPFGSGYTAVAYYTQASVTGAFATATSLSDGSSANGMQPMLRAV